MHGLTPSASLDAAQAHPILVGGEDLFLERRIVARPGGCRIKVRSHSRHLAR